MGDTHSSQLHVQSEGAMNSAWQGSLSQKSRYTNAEIEGEKWLGVFCKLPMGSRTKLQLWTLITRLCSAL